MNRNWNLIHQPLRLSGEIVMTKYWHKDKDKTVKKIKYILKHKIERNKI